MKENISNKILPGSLPIYGYIKLIIISCVLLVAGCKAKKQLIVNRTAVDTAVTSTNIPKPGNPVLAKLDSIRGKQVVFNTFAAKAHAKLALAGNSNDVTLTIRIAKDKKIWVSVTAIAGLEIARALITPDSVLLINRLENLYIKQPFSYLNLFAGNQVNYGMLQSLLIGNAIPQLLNENAVWGANENALTGNLQGLVYKLVLSPDMKVTQTNLTNTDAGQWLQVSNNTFIQAANGTIPSQIDMASLVKNKKIELNLHYTKVEFDKQQDYPFSIPARYTRGN